MHREETNGRLSVSAFTTAISFPFLLSSRLWLSAGEGDCCGVKMDGCKCGMRDGDVPILVFLSSCG